MSGIPLPPFAWNRPPSPRSEEGRDGISPPELWPGNAVQYCVLLKNGEGGIRYTPPPLCVSNRPDPPTLCQGGYPGHPLLRSETLVAGLFLHSSITSETEGNGSPGIVIGGGGYLTPPHLTALMAGVRGMLRVPEYTNCWMPLAGVLQTGQDSKDPSQSPGSFFCQKRRPGRSVRNPGKRTTHRTPLLLCPAGPRSPAQLSERDCRPAQWPRRG